eukprot:288334_1
MDHREIYPPLYVTYQTIYTAMAYPCTVQIFEIALPTTLSNAFSRIVLLLIPILLMITTFYIAYSPIVPKIKHSQDYARTLGPFIQSCYTAFIYSIAVCLRAFYRCCIQKQASHRATYELGNADANAFMSAAAPSISFSFSSPSRGISIKRDATIGSTVIFHQSDLSELTALVDQPKKEYIRNELLQIILAFLVMGGIIATYYWTQYITWQWENLHINQPETYTPISDKINHLLLLYPTFWLVINMIKFVTVRFARYCDTNKVSRHSLELIISFFITCFYYVFYRNLYLHISSYG